MCHRDREFASGFPVFIRMKQQHGQVSNQRSWKRAGGWLCGLTGLLLLFTGCNRVKAPDYDRLQYQLLRDYFAATNDPVQAEKLLDKLADLSPGQPLITLARKQEQFRQVMFTLNRLARERRLEEARNFITLMKAQHGPLPELLQAETIFNALAAVENYRKQQPYSRSADAVKALEPVLRQGSVLNPEPAFGIWLQAQDEDIRQLKARELIQEFNRKLLDLDRLLISGAPNAGTLLQEMKKMNVPTAEAGPALQGLTVPVPDFPASLEALTASPASPLRTVAEIRLCQAWPELTRAQQDAIASRFEKAEPVSRHGKLLQIRILARRGQMAEAIIRSQDLIRQTALSKELVSEGLTVFVLPKEQFLARNWLTPFPTFTDFLLRLEQLRNTP